MCACVCDTNTIPFGKCNFKLERYLFKWYFKIFMAGFFRQPMERPLTNSVSFQHPVHSSLAPRASIPGDRLANDIVRFMLEKML